jgi:Reverse transcriptase (RNA-dependent DNA polymerase)
MGSPNIVMIEWENWKTTSEPLHLIAEDATATYARDNSLLDKPGWKRFKPLAKHEKTFTRMVSQARLHPLTQPLNTNMDLKFPETMNIHCNLMKNGNILWKDAVALELQQISEYQTFIDKGHHKKTTPPRGDKWIWVHLVFDVKNEGRHKARLVADGHLTDIPLDSVHSGVVIIQGFRLVLFLAELNNFQLWAIYIGNAYLGAYTSEKVYIIAGPELGDLEGNLWVISKALHGLRSSCAQLSGKTSLLIAREYLISLLVRKILTFGRARMETYMSMLLNMSMTLHSNERSSRFHQYPGKRV